MTSFRPCASGWGHPCSPEDPGCFRHLCRRGTARIFWAGLLLTQGAFVLEGDQRSARNPPGRGHAARGPLAWGFLVLTVVLQWR
jgi:hypothetical protein